MADIAVYRYDVNVSSNGQTQTITDIGDTSKAFVRILGDTKHGSGGPTGSTSNAGPDDACGAVQLTGTNELTFYRQIGTVKMMVEVWAYTGSAGGAYEFINRGQGSISCSGSSATSSAITAVSDPDDVVPFHSGYTTTENSNSDFEQACFYMYMNGSKQVVVGRNNSGTTGTIYYQAVEFTGSAWSVGHAKSSSHDTGNAHFSGGEVVTMNTDSTGSGGSTFDVSDWDTAMIIDGTMGGDSSETGLSDTMIYILPASATTQIRFTLDNSSSRNDSDAYAHIIQCDDMDVSRNTSSISEGNGSYGTPPSWPTGAPTSGGLDVLSLEWFPGTNGEGTAHARGCLHAMIRDNSGYEIRHWVHRSGNDCEAAYGVVDLSALEDSATAYTIDADGGAIATTGQAASLEKGSVVSADAGSYTTTGQDVDFKYSKLVGADAGSYTTTGFDATLSITSNPIISAESGAYTTTGQDSNLEYNRILSAEAGAVLTTGQEANLEYGRAIDAESGAYITTGFDTTLEITTDSFLQAEAGSVLTTGQGVDFGRTYILSAENGAVLVAGSDVALKSDRDIQADSSSYLTTGYSVNTLYGKALSIESGNYLTTGQSADLFKGWAIISESGQVVTVGQDASLLLEGIPEPEIVTLVSALEKEVTKVTSLERAKSLTSAIVQAMGFNATIERTIDYGSAIERAKAYTSRLRDGSI